MTQDKLGERLWKLKLVLDETVEFPTEYLFKFIVPLSEVPHILYHLNGFEVTEKPSANGNYVSISAKKIFNESGEIIKVYRSVSSIKGLIAL